MRSYIMHDPMHIFFKIPRPVHRPLESPFPLLPPLLVPYNQLHECYLTNFFRYRVPAGPPPSAPKTNDPQGTLSLMSREDHDILTHRPAYLNSLKHTSALCDRCMTSIVGEWFRCAYCARDLCDSCQEVDTHNDTHVFIVFKSIVCISQTLCWKSIC